MINIKDIDVHYSDLDEQWFLFPKIHTSENIKSFLVELMGTETLESAQKKIDSILNYTTDHKQFISPGLKRRSDAIKVLEHIYEILPLFD